MTKLAWTVVAVTIAASLAGCGHGAAIKAETLARANAACSRENAKIAADEQHPTVDFSIASVEAIRHEVSRLTQLGLARHLQKSFAEVDRATAAILWTSSKVRSPRTNTCWRLSERLPGLGFTALSAPA